MPTVKLLVLLLAASSQATASDLETLDRIGRLVAAKPCPKPQVTSRAEKNIHDETITDRFITQRCEKAGSTIVRSSSSSHTTVFPLYATLATADPRVPAPFQVGSSLSSLKQRLGAPEVEKPNTVTYLLPSESREERVTFVHNGSRIREVQWSWYFD